MKKNCINPHDNLYVRDNNTKIYEKFKGLNQGSRNYSSPNLLLKENFHLLVCKYLGKKGM